MANDIPQVTVIDHKPPRYLMAYTNTDGDEFTQGFDTEEELQEAASKVCEDRPGVFVDLYVYAGSKRQRAPEKANG